MDTLNSIYEQTYERLELIISDDCSTDGTIAVCKEWISQHSHRFQLTKVIESASNTGVSGNLNRGWAHCSGKWIKSIAADDVLLPICIETYINYALSHPEEYFLFGKVIFFGDNEETVRIRNEQGFDYEKFALSASEQHDTLVFQKHNFVPAPSSFFHREKFLEFGFSFDERIPLLEDWPMWIMITAQGFKLNLVEEYTVKYRLSGNTLSSAGSLNISFNRSFRIFYFYYLFPSIYTKDATSAIEDVISYENRLFADKVAYIKENQRLRNTVSYKLGHSILKPIKNLLRLFL